MLIIKGGRRDSLLRHLSSHAKSPARSSQLKQGNHDDESHQLDASADEPTQVLHDATTLPEPCESISDQNAAAKLLNMPGATSSANVEDETDIDVPPELAGNYHGPVCVRPDHDDHRINVSLDHRDSLEGASNYAIAIRSAETCGSSGQNYDLDIVHQRHSARIDIQPDLLELPEALYSKAVDVHARRWLNDFCAGDREGPE